MNHHLPLSLSVINDGRHFFRVHTGRKDDQCSIHDDCPDVLECKDGRCQDPCYVCGERASCQASRHRAICSCPPGHFGDPRQKCIWGKVNERYTFISTGCCGNCSHPLSPATIDQPLHSSHVIILQVNVRRISNVRSTRLVIEALASILACCPTVAESMPVAEVTTMELYATVQKVIEAIRTPCALVQLALRMTNVQTTGHASTSSAIRHVSLVHHAVPELFVQLVDTELSANVHHTSLEIPLQSALSVSHCLKQCIDP